MLPSKSDRSLLRAWLHVFRVPNLCTVPGDPLAGFLLSVQGGPVSPWRLMGGIVAALLFYMAGLALNDWCDRDEDAADRPARPIPSGQLAASTVLGAALLLIAVALGICRALGMATLEFGLGLAAVIVAYNVYLKSVALIGPLAMSACRALSLLLGASILTGWGPLPGTVILAASILFAYVFTFSVLARQEMNPRPPGMKAWLPFGVLLAGFILFIPWLPTDGGLLVGYGLACCAAGILAFRAAIRLNRVEIPRGGAPVSTAWPAQIGQLISALLFMQAAFVCASGEVLVVWALVLVLAWPISRRLAKRFYMS